jgi:hypothetical protein
LGNVTSYDATHLTSTIPLREFADFLTDEYIEPKFPRDGSGLDQVRWKAGLLELVLNRLVQVVVDDEGIGIRFVRTEAHGDLSGSGSPYRFDHPAVEAYLQGLIDMAILVRDGAFDSD